MTVDTGPPGQGAHLPGRQRTRRSSPNITATVLVTLAVLVALVPLVWVLYIGDHQGLPGHSRQRPGSPTRMQRHDGVRRPAAASTTRSIGTLLQGLVCAVISIPIGHLRRHLPGRVRRRHAGWASSPRSWSTSSPVSRRSWPRCSSTRCGSRRSASPSPASRCRWPWCC